MMWNKKWRKLPFILLGCLATSGCGSGGSGTTPKPQAGNAAILSVSGGNVFDFSGQLIGSVTSLSFTVSNVGDRSATDMSGSFYLSQSFAFKDGHFPGTGGTCTDTLIPGGICTVTVSFSPKGLGQSESTLEIAYNDGTSAKATTTPVLRGRGL